MKDPIQPTLEAIRERLLDNTYSYADIYQLRTLLAHLCSKVTRKVTYIQQPAVRKSMHELHYMLFSHYLTLARFPGGSNPDIVRSSSIQAIEQLLAVQQQSEEAWLDADDTL